MDYDMDIHHNPDAQAWAKFFIESTKDMDREVFSDEGYMIAWFANAMMAMYDSMDPQKAANEIVRLREVSQQQLDAAYRNGYDAAYAMGYSEGLKETLYDGMPRRDDRDAKIERLRKILSIVLEACEDVNSPDRKVREEITKTIGKALKEKT